MEQISQDLRKLLFIYSQRNALEKKRNCARHRAYYSLKAEAKLKRTLYPDNIFILNSNLTKTQLKKLLSRVKKHKVDFIKYDRLTKKAANKKAAITKRYKKFIRKTIKRFNLRIVYDGYSAYVKLIRRNVYWEHEDYIEFSNEDLDSIAAEYEAEKAFERIINGQEKISKKDKQEGQTNQIGANAS